MKITAWLINGAKIDWEEPGTGFNLPMAVSHYRSAGFIQSPTFYINMGAVAMITSGDQKVELPMMPPGNTLQ